MFCSNKSTLGDVASPGVNGVDTKQVQMYYRSGTGLRCCIGAEQALCVHSAGSSIFLHEMMS